MADWVYFNPNPREARVGDCVIRAISAVTGDDWDTTYTGVTLQGYALKDMPSANHVWRAYLRSKGFKQAVIPDSCPNCYTVGDFADDHPTGRFVLGTGVHAVGIVDGRVLDTWNSLGEIPITYFYEG